MKNKLMLVVVIALAIAISLISGQVRKAESIRTNIRDAGIKQEQHNILLEEKLKSTEEELKKQHEENKKLNDALQARAKEKEAQKAVALVAVAKAAPAAAPLPPGSHQDWMAAAGIAASNYGFVDYIVSHESGWCPTKWNGQKVCPASPPLDGAGNIAMLNPFGGSDAYGLGQALPPSKMATYGADFMSNPVTQLRWAQAYAVARYGSWQNAYNYWLAHGVW